MKPSPENAYLCSCVCEKLWACVCQGYSRWEEEEGCLSVWGGENTSEWSVSFCGEFGLSRPVIDWKMHTWNTFDSGEPQNSVATNTVAFSL